MTATDTTTDLAEELTPEQAEQAARVAELLAARSAVESAAAKEIGKHSKLLTASRNAAADAVADAQAALVRMIEKIDEYNGNLKTVTTDLLDRGLAASDEAGGPHETGATVRNEVRLTGTWWLPVNAVAMFERTTNTARRAALSWITQRVMSSTVQAEFLERIPDLPVKPAPPRVSWGATMPSHSPKLTGRELEEAKRDREVKWREIPWSAITGREPQR